MTTLLLGVWLAGATPQVTGLVQGAVMRGDASDPIAGVELVLNGPANIRLQATSDAQGAFIFDRLPRRNAIHNSCRVTRGWAVR